MFGYLLQNQKECYCAFCKSPRRIFKRKNINIVNILASALGAAIIMFLIWQEFDPRSLFIFVILLAISETFIQLRWRITMVCRHCGFDPVLYVKNTALAAEKVKKHLEKRKADPATLLSRPLDLPKLPKEKAEQLKKLEEAQGGKKGGLISRQI